MSDKTLKAEQKHLKNLVMRCSIVVGHHGRILYYKERLSTLTSLAMTYKGQGLVIEFSTLSRHPHSSGTCKVVVQKRKLVVFEASGVFMNNPHRVNNIHSITAKIYVPGSWEKKIRVTSRMK